MPRTIPTELLSILAKSVGRETANLELRWMKDVAQNAHQLHSMVARRARGEPLQYILGTQPFGPLNLLTRPPVLIPRPETEHWTLRLAELLHPTPRSPISLLDLCTGSGCIPLLLCHVWPPGSIHALGTDISGDAIRLAMDNARLCGFQTPADSVLSSPPQEYEETGNTFLPLMGDIRDPGFATKLPAWPALRPPFDVITSNPPYIPAAEYEVLPPSVKDYEDPRALLGDPDPSALHSGKGLTFYHDIIRLAAHEGLLANDGMVVVEVGMGQAGDVAEIFEEEGGFRKTEIWKDLWDVQRVVVGLR